MRIYLLTHQNFTPITIISAPDFPTAKQMADRYRRDRCIFTARLWTHGFGATFGFDDPLLFSSFSL